MPMGSFLRGKLMVWEGVSGKHAALASRINLPPLNPRRDAEKNPSVGLSEMHAPAEPAVLFLIHPDCGGKGLGGETVGTGGGLRAGWGPHAPKEGRCVKVENPATRSGASAVGEDWRTGAAAARIAPEVEGEEVGEALFAGVGSGARGRGR